MIVTKPIDIPLLTKELLDAGIILGGPLGWRELSTPGTFDLYVIVGGMPAPLPPEAGPIVDAHEAPLDLTKLSRRVVFDDAVRTTGVAPEAIIRIECDPEHTYRVEFDLIAIDSVPVNGTRAVKEASGRVVFRRGQGAPSVVPVVGGPIKWTEPFQDTAATSWTVLPTFDTANGKNDAVLSVRGATGRTIDWLVEVRVKVFAPEGLIEEAVPPPPPISPPPGFPPVPFAAPPAPEPPVRAPQKPGKARGRRKE
jgi:hypothetical protein